jgi:E3 ubiquitin-protein ligase SHPRH
LALHAPSLKVFIYEGWAKLSVPITEYDVEIERDRRRSGGKIKSVTSRAKSRGTKGKKGKGKAAYSDDDDDYMDVDKPAATFSTIANADDGEEILDWCSYINTFDVCITTYNTLRQDFSVARAPPVRPRREDVVYSNIERARSPLVMCEWHRVIMDEVQMVGGGKIE